MFNMYVHFRFGKHQALPNMDVVRYFKGFASENGWMSARKMERTARTKRRSKPSHTWRVDHGKRLIWAWNTGIVSTQKKELNQQRNYGDTVSSIRHEISGHKTSDSGYCMFEDSLPMTWTHQCWGHMIWNANIVDHVWVRHGDSIHRQSNNTFSWERGMRTRTLNLPHTCPEIGPQMDWRFYDKETTPLLWILF